MADAPYFEGPNSFQANVQHELEKILKEKGYTLSQIKNIQLDNATIEVPDTLPKDLISSVTLQLVSDEIAMQKVAVLNPFISEASKVELQVAQEQKDIEKYFTKDYFTVVLDANFNKDVENNLQFYTTLNFSVFLK